MLHSDYLAESPSQPRPGMANNLPGAMATKPGWNDPTMKAAKLFGWLYAIEKAGSEDRLENHREWADVGVRAKPMLLHIRHLLPMFDKVWADQGRKSEPGKALHNRVWYMYHWRSNGELHHGRSVEHPQNSKNLQPYRDVAKRLYRANRPLAMAQVMEHFG